MAIGIGTTVRVTELGRVDKDETNIEVGDTGVVVDSFDEDLHYVSLFEERGIYGSSNAIEINGKLCYALYDSQLEEVVDDDEDDVCDCPVCRGEVSFDDLCDFEEEEDDFQREALAILADDYKAVFDSFVEAGFTPGQAMQILLKTIEVAY